MKKTIILALTLVFLLSSSVACSEKQADDGKIDTPVSDTTEKTEKTEVNDTTEVPDTPAEETDTDEGETNAEEAFDIALSLVDHPVAELYAAIGEPEDKSYASSCMGSGQDGELYYDGFIVCTYLEGEEETVVDVYK